MSYIIKANTFIKSHIPITTLCLKCWLRQLNVPEAMIQPMQDFYQDWRDSRCIKFQTMHQDKLQLWLEAGYDLSAIMQTTSTKKFSASCVLTIRQVLDVMRDMDWCDLSSIRLYDVSKFNICDIGIPHIRMNSEMPALELDSDFWQNVMLDSDVSTYGDVAIHYSILNQDVELVRMLMQQNIDPKSEIMKYVTSFKHFSKSTPLRPEFMELFGWETDIRRSLEIHEVLNSENDIASITQTYQLANFDSRQKAKLIMKLMQSFDANISHVRRMIQEMSDLDWSEITADMVDNNFVMIRNREILFISHVQRIIQEMSDLDWSEITADMVDNNFVIRNREILLWCVAQDWPLNVLQQSIIYAVRSDSRDYMPIIQAIQPMIQANLFSIRMLTEMISRCHDLDFLNLCIRENYLNVMIHTELILDAMTDILFNVSYQKNGPIRMTTILHEMISYLQMQPNLCTKIIRKMMEYNLDDGLILQVLDATNIKIDAEDVCRLAYTGAINLAKILAHRAFDTVDWNQQLTLEKAQQLCQRNTKDADIEAQLNVTSGLSDITILEFVLMVGDKGNVQPLLHQLLQKNVTIDWSRLNSYYTYYLETNIDDIRRIYPSRHPLCQFSCRYGDVECFFARFFTTEPFATICGFMLLANVLDTRIAYLWNQTQEMLKKADIEDAFYFSETESDVSE